MNSKHIVGIIIVIAVFLCGCVFVIHSNYPNVATASITDNKINNLVASTTKAMTYGIDVVSQHNNVSSCWTTIEGKVYDVTTWINQHPGGAQAILSLCGKDGSAAFNNQHGGQAKPAKELASFYIGDLK